MLSDISYMFIEGMTTAQNTDSLLMSLLLSQEKMIGWLSAQLCDKQHHHEVIKVEL